MSGERDKSAPAGAEAPSTAQLRLDSIDFPSGREMSSFCDLMGEDFERVMFQQEA